MTMMMTMMLTMTANTDDDDDYSNLHEYIGPRLSDDIYYYLTQGLISPQVSLAWAAQTDPTA